MSKKFIDLPIKEALQQKFERGKTKHRIAGSMEFAGDPLEELFEEMLDSIHYCDEALKRGIDLEHRRRQFVSTALELQTIHRNALNDAFGAEHS